MYLMIGLGSVGFAYDKQVYSGLRFLAAILETFTSVSRGIMKTHISSAYSLILSKFSFSLCT